jgi:hypothetical protein
VESEPRGANRLAAQVICKTASPNERTGTLYQARKSATSGSSSARLRAALAYAKHGIEVFPCNPAPDKSPRTRRGYLDASTDAARVHAYWTRHPDASIGMPTGERTGGWVLDVDGADGLDALAELEREHGKPGSLATLTVRTPRGGLHLHFTHPGFPVKCSVGELAPGLDVRGDGGYVLVPPSDGYEWADRTPRADAPEWLLELIREPASLGAAPRSESGQRRSFAGPVDADPASPGEPIPDGERNRTLFRIACSLRARGLDDAELLAALEEINARRCSPPVDARELAKIARSVARYPAGKALGERVPETREVLERIERVLWAHSWPGMGGKSERDVMVSLVLIARNFGRLEPGGLFVACSRRTLALAAGLSLRATENAIKRLEAAGELRTDTTRATAKPARAGAFVLTGEATPRKGSTVTSSVSLPNRESGETTVLPLRAPYTAPRLRWSAPRWDRIGDEMVRSTQLRPGKSAGALIDALERRGGTATLEEVAADLGIKRPRDLRRRAVARLEAAGVVAIAGDVLSLTTDWLDALNRERELNGELAAHRRDMARYAREREAYRKRHETPADRAPSEAEMAPGREERHAQREIDVLVAQGMARSWAALAVYRADGFIEELRPVEEPPPSEARRAKLPPMRDGIYHHGAECACEWCFEEPA